jgi:hypothetical protein
MIKSNKKLLILVLVIIGILLLLLPIKVLANNIIFPKVVEHSDNAREIELEKIERNNVNNSSAIDDTHQITKYEESEEERIESELVEQENIDTNNKILEIVQKYAPNQMNEIYEELNGSSIYDVNLELEYKFDNIILDIIENQDIETDEKDSLIDYMYGEYGNVKDNIELYNRIEDVCK